MMHPLEERELRGWASCLGNNSQGQTRIWLLLLLLLLLPTNFGTFWWLAEI
jgi:hypothetical protein